DNNELRRILADVLWMAQRYADGRHSYATSTLNQAVRDAAALGVRLNPTVDRIVFARDAMAKDQAAGVRSFDHLTADEARPGTPAAMGELLPRRGQMVLVFAERYRDFVQAAKDDAAVLGIDWMKPKAVAGTVTYPTEPSTHYVWVRDDSSARDASC